MDQRPPEVSNFSVALPLGQLLQSRLRIEPKCDELVWLVRHFHGVARAGEFLLIHFDPVAEVGFLETQSDELQFGFSDAASDLAQAQNPTVAVFGFLERDELEVRRVERKERTARSP